MKRTFNLVYDRQLHTLKILPHLRTDGMHYEVNLAGYDRFYLRWGALRRYELAPPSPDHIPEDLVLAVNDVIEEHFKRR